MNRTSTVQILYNTGDYSNTTFIDEITEIPESIGFDKEKMAILRSIQMLEIEQAFNTYIQMAKFTRSHSVKEILATLQEAGTENKQLADVAKALEELKTKTYEEFLDKIKEEVK